MLLKYSEAKCRLDLSDSGQGPVAGSWDYRTEPSGSIKCRELDWLSKRDLLLEVNIVSSIFLSS
jgi:hypothetical protein